MNANSIFTPGLVAAQQPTWPDAAAVAAAVSELESFPPLVFAGECDNLKKRIGEAALGNAFWLQGGDCAETFVAATADSIRNRIKTILQMAAVLQYFSSLPVVKVGRMAGQFAKPRSNESETRDGVTLPAYRGDAVNDLEFNRVIGNGLVKGSVILLGGEPGIGKSTFLADCILPTLSNFICVVKPQFLKIVLEANNPKLA